MHIRISNTFSTTFGSILSKSMKSLVSSYTNYNTNSSSMYCVNNLYGLFLGGEYGLYLYFLFPRPVSHLWLRSSNTHRDEATKTHPSLLGLEILTPRKQQKHQKATLAAPNVPRDREKKRCVSHCAYSNVCMPGLMVLRGAPGDNREKRQREKTSTAFSLSPFPKGKYLRSLDVASVPSW